MGWYSRDDDNPVGLVGEGLVVAVGAGGAAADGGSRHGVAGSGIDQGLDLGGNLRGKSGSLVYYLTDWVRLGIVRNKGSF